MKLSGTTTFIPRPQGTAFAHASTLLVTDAGVLAAFFAGSKEGNDDVGIYVVSLGDVVQGDTSSEGISPEGISAKDAAFTESQGRREVPRSRQGTAQSTAQSTSQRTPTRVHDGVVAAHWNPVLFRGNDGAVVMYYKVGNLISTWETYVTRSVDNGGTFSRPQRLVEEDPVNRGPGAQQADSFGGRHDSRSVLP